MVLIAVPRFPAPHGDVPRSACELLWAHQDGRKHETPCVRSSQPPALGSARTATRHQARGPLAPSALCGPTLGYPKQLLRGDPDAGTTSTPSHHAHRLRTRANHAPESSYNSHPASCFSQVTTKSRLFLTEQWPADRRGEWPAGAGDQTPCHLPSWAAAMLHRQALHCPREGCGTPLERAAGPAAVQGGQQRRRSLLCCSQGCYDHCWAIHSSLGIKARLDIPATICWMSADQEGGYPQRRSRPPRGSWF